MAFVNVPGGSIHYEVAGSSGDPTVLVHGSWVDGRTWGRLLPLLAPALSMVAYDRRGHGESTGPPRAHPVRDDAEDLARLLEGVDQYPAHVIAHSYGGAVAFRLALDRPEMVRSLAVHEPPFLGLVDRPGELAEAAAVVAPEIERLRQRVRAGDREGAAHAFLERFGVTPGAWERLAPSVRAGWVRNADRWAEEFGDPQARGPTRAELAELDLPVLVTTGDASPGILRGIAEELGRALRNATVRTLPGAGHVPHLTHPEAYAGALVTFLLERDVPST